MLDPTDPSDRLLAPDDLHKRWGVSKGTAANWRSAGKGPRFIKLGNGIVRYRLSDVIAFEDAGLVSSN